MALWTVGADRLALALLGAQPVDEGGADKEADHQRSRGRRSSTEADVANEIEDAGKTKLLGQYIEH